MLVPAVYTNHAEAFLNDTLLLLGKLPASYNYNSYNVSILSIGRCTKFIAFLFIDSQISRWITLLCYTLLTELWNFKLHNIKNIIFWHHTLPILQTTFRALPPHMQSSSTSASENAFYNFYLVCKLPLMDTFALILNLPPLEIDWCNHWTR